MKYTTMFNSPDFIEAWELWKKHKTEKHGSPYTVTGEQMALSALFKKSHGVEELAIESINTSIEKNWANIYINGNGKINGSTSTNGKTGTSSDRMEAARKW